MECIRCGKDANIDYCKACISIIAWRRRKAGLPPLTKQYRGRSSDEMDEINKNNVKCKIFTQEEIKAYANNL